jgi:hypothetical protein
MHAGHNKFDNKAVVAYLKPVTMAARPVPSIP